MNERDNATDAITTGPGEIESLVDFFHRVQSLIPAGQKLVTVEPETRVADALAIMQQHHYSQLPVMAGDTVLGVFSYRSFGTKALQAQKKVGKEWLGTLPVEDFLEEFEYADPAEDWNQVIGHLNEDDAFFVGRKYRLEGMVTTMDTLHYFQQIANPFIVLAEVELSLRQVIQVCVGEDAMPQAIKVSLEPLYGMGQTPSTLVNLTLDNFVQIIANSDNWPYFESIFGKDERTRREAESRLRQLVRWRNDVFHFRRQLEAWELKTLSDHRNWLRVRVEAYLARQRSAASEPNARKGNRVKTNRANFLVAVPPVTAPFFAWLLDEAQRRGFLVEWRQKGLAIRHKRPDRPISFAYAYPPDRYEAFFGYLELDGAAELELRRALLATGVFQDGGTKTVRAFVSQFPLERLKKATVLLMDRIAAIGRYPLPIRWTWPGVEHNAEMLDAGGRIRFNGVVYNSASAAAKVAGGGSFNGWKVWQFFDEAAGQWKPIDALRGR